MTRHSRHPLTLLMYQIYMSDPQSPLPSPNSTEGAPNGKSRFNGWLLLNRLGRARHE